MLADLNLENYVPIAIDEQPWSTNKLDLRGYALRGQKCIKTVKSTVPSMTITLAVSPFEIIGCSFVVKSNLEIYFADFVRKVMLKLRKK